MDFQKFFGIPNNVLKTKYRKLIHDSFDYNTSKFSNKIFIFYIFLETVKSLVLFSHFIFFKKKMMLKKKYDFIINGIGDKRSYERYEKLIEKFSSSLVISNIDLNKKKVTR